MAHKTSQGVSVAPALDDYDYCNVCPPGDRKGPVFSLTFHHNEHQATRLHVCTTHGEQIIQQMRLALGGKG